MLSLLFQVLLRFLLDDAFEVLWTEEVPLSSGGNQSLPFIVFPAELLGTSTHQEVYWDHHWLIPDNAHREVSVPSEDSMDGMISQPRAEDLIFSVSWSASNCVLRIQVLNGQLHVMVLLCILG
mmetsp:Transcript_27583/g.26616  ORF Transcript_27583/g.26616 Transcript_27583/m.26616 type:complete len:123 (-) Transcript_27583:1312-1680(-)